MTRTGDICMVGITCDYGITLAMRSHEYSLYHLGDHIYCCARALAGDIFAEIKIKLAAQYLNQNLKIPIKKAQELLWQLYPDITTDPVLLAAQENNRQYLYATQLDGSCTDNNHVAASGRGTAIAEAMDWLAKNWDRNQDLMMSEVMARKVLQNWDTFQNTSTEVIVLYKRKEDAALDTDDSK
ncbi:uncharacterized protein LOC117590760 [Drosophila guanche]|uniref:Uncharacterized protein n=1 Tax=Drosophila guanche TaxID=7266 RepID=A0A3B0JQX4_DROGU|nr:uncharacterized protein LOC117590760 [Drosophila guanche]SPP73548.1 Hypothetical predicted protein [Drosophila guanche]